MESVINLFPWLVVLFIYVGEKIQQWYLSKALNTALERAQGVTPPIIIPPARLPSPVVQPSPQVTPKPPVIDAAPPVIDAALIDFVKKQEGFVAKAKWDYKQYTNGYGTKALSPTEVIDTATAMQRLTQELGNAVSLVENFAPKDAPRGVKQALADLTFNAGPGWEHAGLGAVVKAGDYIQAKVHLLEYTRAGGQVIEDLVKRRNAEASWFDNPL